MHSRLSLGFGLATLFLATCAQGALSDCLSDYTSLNHPIQRMELPQGRGYLVPTAKGRIELVAKEGAKSRTLIDINKFSRAPQLPGLDRFLPSKNKLEIQAATLFNNGKEVLVYGFRAEDHFAEITQWDSETGKFLDHLTVELSGRGPVTEMHLSPNQQQWVLMQGGSADLISQRSYLRHRSIGLVSNESYSRSAKFLGFSNNSSMLLLGHNYFSAHTGFIRLIDCDTGQAELPMIMQDQIRSAGFSPDDKWIIVLDKGGTASIWDVGATKAGIAMASGRHFRSDLDSDGEPITDISFSPDGQRLEFSWGGRDSHRFLNLNEIGKIDILPFHGISIKHIFAKGTRDGDGNFMPVPTETVIPVLSTDGKWSFWYKDDDWDGLQLLPNAEIQKDKIDYSPDFKLALVGQAGDLLVDSPDGRGLIRMNKGLDGSPVVSVKFSQDGKHLRYTTASGRGFVLDF